MSKNWSDLALRHSFNEAGKDWWGGKFPENSSLPCLEQAVRDIRNSGGRNEAPLACRGMPSGAHARIVIRKTFRFGQLSKEPPPMPGPLTLRRERPAKKVGGWLAKNRSNLLSCHHLLLIHSHFSDRIQHPDFLLCTLHLILLLHLSLSLFL